MRQQPEDQQRGQQGVRAGVGEAQPGNAVSIGGEDGAVTAVKPSAPRAGSWLSRWTPSRHRLADKPISRRAGRLVSRLPIPKSRVSLIVVSVRSARPSLWYCLIVACL